MPKPLYLFIAPPYASGDNPAGAWTLVHGYGPAAGAPGAPPVFHTDIVLETNSAGTLRAVAHGRLSRRPPGSSSLGAEEQLELALEAASPPDTLTLYLHLSPVVTSDNAFRAQAQGAGGIIGFAYLGVEASSLEGALAELLDQAVFPAGSLTRADVMKLFLDGVLDIPVTASHAIGSAGMAGALAGPRRVGFTVLTPAGPVDAAHIYDRMRDFVEDGQAMVDAFLGLVPKRWPVIDANLGTDQAIALTATAIYSWPVLEELRTTRALTPTQWRTVGNHQKTLYRARLLERLGHAPPGGIAPPFEFNDIDWKNVFQLEAVVELYANFDDPWATGATPRHPGDVNYTSADFLDLAGATASVAGNVVTLLGAPALGRVWNRQDTLFLEGDTVRPTRLYRITSVNAAASTVTVDGNPVLSGPTSAWTIHQRPVLVLIDGFGPRLRGFRATISSNDARVLVLDGNPDLRKVNTNFDTLYLSADAASARRTYRITAVNNTARTVTLDGEPALADGSSPWAISSGISGELPPLAYTLGPHNPPGAPSPRGNDHYDGTVFVIHRNTVHRQVRFSSYTSRNYAAGAQSLSSVRGNRRYQLSSFRSNQGFRNYCFKVTDPDAGYDGVQEARFYFSTPVTEDRAIPPQEPQGAGPGKTEIRVHLGSANLPAGGSGSAGCLVSPLFFDLRRELIARFQADSPTGPDTDVQKADVLTRPLSEQLLNGAILGGLSANRWNGKITGTLWLIRPDERPLN
jgi:hypothetical protein